MESKTNLSANNDCPTLCFKKEEFMKGDFSVDKFVSECRKQTSLETMREDLGVYLRVLHSAMVELINKDYADFVNLSSNLVGLDKSIKNISMPLGQLKEEVLNVKTGLDESLTSARKKLKEREEVHKKKVLVQRIISILEGIEKIERQNVIPVYDATGKKRLLSGEVIERVAVELNQLQFHMSKVEGHSLVNENQTKAINKSDILQQHLELMFLDSIDNSDAENLRKVLRTYSTIDKIKEIENKFCRLVVRPYMRKVITEDLITEQGLQKMYSYVLDFIPSKCKVILEVTRGTKKEAETLKGYDFLVNAVWPEIVLCLEYIGPVIFAPGNPSLFHHNYCASMEFVSQFEHSCIVQTSVKRLRDHMSYKSFIEKWNLLVYFQIRYQEIGGSFEMSLLSAFSSPNVNTPYHLYVSYCLWLYTSRCWDDDVFLFSLCHKFWKLTLQLISRYGSWVNNTLDTETAILHKGDSSAEDCASVSTLTPGSTISRSSKLPDNSESICSEELLSLNHLIMLVQDTELLLSDIKKLFKGNIQYKLCLRGKEAEKIEEAFQNSTEMLSDLPEKIGMLIVKHLIAQCAQNLKLVTDIPRLYRRTNREVPSKPSGYVSLVLKPLEAFFCDTGKSLSSEWKTKWLQDVLDGITKQYLVVTTDVITSIKKMEDSLKRLKRARDKPMGQISSGIMSDDDKIRLQLMIDAEHFGKQIKNLGFENSNIQSFEQLKILVQSAMKSSNTNS